MQPYLRFPCYGLGTGRYAFLPFPDCCRYSRRVPVTPRALNGGTPQVVVPCLGDLPPARTAMPLEYSLGTAPEYAINCEAFPNLRNLPTSATIVVAAISWIPGRPAAPGLQERVGSLALVYVSRSPAFQSGSRSPRYSAGTRRRWLRSARINSMLLSHTREGPACRRSSCVQEPSRQYP